MDTKKQTAVDWLFKILWDTRKDKLEWYAILAQAKQMEKEQIIDAATWGALTETAEQYYTQTYERNRDNQAL